MSDQVIDLVEGMTIPDYAQFYTELSKVPSVVTLKLDKAWMKRVVNPHRKSSPHYEGIVPLTELIKIPFGNINPRYPTLKGAHVKEITNSILKNGDTHDLRSLGVWVLVRKYASRELGKEDFELNLYYPTPLKKKEHDPDGARAGISNGGLTYVLGVQAAMALIDEYKRIADDPLTLANGNPMPFFPIRIYADVEEMASDMAAAQNNNIQMPVWAVTDELNDLIKNVMAWSNKSLFDLIEFSPNELKASGKEKPFDLLDVVQRLTLCLWKRHEHPVRAYSGRTALVDFYVDNKADYDAFLPETAQTVFVLPELVEEILPKARPKYARLDRDWMRPLMKAGKFDTTGAKREYEVAQAVVYPVVAALRVLIGPKSGKFKQDVRQFLEHNKMAIYKAVDNAYRDYAKKEKGDAKRVLSAMGKDRIFWAAIYQAVYEIVNPSTE